MNGLYDSLCIILVFPLIVFLGASGQVQGRFSKVNKFLGDISYPVYIIHYPFIYVLMAWAANNKVSLTEPSSVSMGLLVAVAFGTLFVTVVFAWACVKLYDEPVRRWLTKRFMPSYFGS